ncbi:MAG TPA: apolipoprotein N-acyltransferase [Spirochaetota bacterium]|nr:apolipoprotein N-acyltransferase [Spirochaetota bacterium]
MERLKNFLAGAKNWFAARYYLATAPLMFLSFPSHDVWFLKGFPFFAWFSLAPVFVFLRKKTLKEMVYHSFAVFLLGNLLAFSWIGNFGAEVSGGYTVILVFLIPSLTVFMVTKVVIAELLSRRFEALRPLIFPAAWILVDWVQSLGFLAFPWTYWGYSQYPFTAFIQMARVTGVMGVTFTLVLVNTLAADLWYRARSEELQWKGLIRTATFRKLAAAALAVILITVAGASLLAMHAGQGRRDLRVAMVQSCIDPWDNWTRNRMRYLNQLAHYTFRAARENPDLVIWSESATLEMISYDYAAGTMNEFEQRVLELARVTGKPILTGEIGRQDDAIRGVTYYQNNAVLIDAAGSVVKSYSKINLVPFGEWFPYERWFRWVKSIVDSFGASSFTPGTELATFEVLGRKFGTLVCYEGIFFRHVRRYAALGVDFLVNITNDGWTDTYNGHMQHFSASVFRAVENGLWMVRAGNTGYTTLVDPYGRVSASIPILIQGYLAGDMDFGLNHQTFYARYGDVFSYAAFAFLGACCLIAVAGNIRKRKGGDTRS